MNSKLWALPGPLPSTPAEASAFKRTVSQLYTCVDDSEHLIEPVEAVLPRLEAAGLLDLWVHTEWCIATRYAILGQHDRVAPRVARALAKASPSETPVGYLNLLNLQGLSYKFTGDYARAVETHLAQLQVVRSHGLDGYGSAALTNLAYTLMEMGCTAHAARVLEDEADLLEHASGADSQNYWAARLTCADLLQDRATARKAIDILDTLLARARECNETANPTALAVVRAMGPVARLPLDASPHERAEAGAALLEEATRPTRFMPGYRLKAAAAAARIALSLGQPDLALQLVDVGRAVQPDDLPIAWAIDLEDIAAEVHEARGDFALALAATRQARSLHEQQTCMSLSNAVSALLDRVHNNTSRLRAVELEEVNQALRRTTERLDNALRETTEARHAAEQAADARHRFLSRMSHELRTPLQGVVGTIELLRDTALSREQSELVDLLDQSSNLTRGIVDDILELGKVEMDTLEVTAQPFHLRDMAQDTLRNVQALAHVRNTKLELSFDPALPERVLGDRHRIVQVLVNLLSNAIKFTPGGEVALDVSAEGQQVRFTVRDTGCGIEPADLDHIFDPYVRTSRSRALDIEGSGLGLTIAHGIAQAMRGSLTAESTPGKGSTFSLRLPLATAPQDHSASVQPHAPATGSLVGTKVLVAEDNPISQTVLGRHLRHMGVELMMVDNGQHALELATTEPWELLILDFHMPDMDGLEVSRRLRHQGSTLPIIGLTASALPEDKTAAYAAQMDAYATKPISRTALEQLIWKVLRPSHEPTSPAGRPYS